MEQTIANLDIAPFPEPFVSARQKAELLAKPISLDSEGTWVICQSLAEDLHFEFYRGVLPGSFEQSIAGRIFSPEGELRWLRVGTECKLWLTVERANAPLYRRRLRRYYLWGMNADEETFFENRMPRAFHYPLPANIAPKIDDRAFIEVAEYLAGPPNEWPQDSGKIERILNQPEIVAHRYLRVGCGTSSDEVKK